MKLHSPKLSGAAEGADHGRSPALVTLVACLVVAATFVSCGGGGSSTPPPPANNPVPTLASISPTTTGAGGGPFTITVNGTNFISTSEVHWNGALRTTTFVNSTQLTATVTAQDIQVQGTAQVTVFNPTPGGGTSAAQTFTITAPVPAITSLSPSSAVAGQAGFTLTVNGTNFVSGSTVNWNGSPRATTGSASPLTAQITQADVATAGTAQVTVVNPGTPASAAVNFTITAPQPLAVATTLLPPSANGKNYYFVLASSGGVPPITWSLASGSGPLPSGLALDASGLISGTITAGAGTSNFTVQATDFQSHTVTAPLSIAVNSTLGRNDNVCVSLGVFGSDTATPISNGTLRATISPYGDVDTYTFTLTTTVTNLTIETFAQELDIANNLTTRIDFLDTVLELLDQNCNLVALNDDQFIPTATSGGTHIQDSLIVVGSNPFPVVPSPCVQLSSTVSCADKSAPTFLTAGKYYIRVRDFRGDGRPDLLYDLQVTGIQ